MPSLRKLASCILAGALTLQSLHAQQSPANREIQQRISALPVNAHVALQLTDGNTLRGHIASRADHDFVLKPDNGGAPQTIAYEQVSAVEQVKKHSTKKWIVIGVVAGAVVIGVIAIVLAVHHPIGVHI